MSDVTESGTVPEEEATSLEARLARLEEILVRLESDGVALEEAMELFEEGVAHVRASESLLTATQLRVEELLASGGTRDLDVDEE